MFDARTVAVQGDTRGDRPDTPLSQAVGPAGPFAPHHKYVRAGFPISPRKCTLAGKATLSAGRISPKLGLTEADIYTQFITPAKMVYLFEINQDCRI